MANMTVFDVQTLQGSISWRTWQGLTFKVQGFHSSRTRLEVTQLRFLPPFTVSGSIRKPEARFLNATTYLTPECHTLPVALCSTVP